VLLEELSLLLSDEAVLSVVADAVVDAVSVLSVVDVEPPQAVSPITIVALSPSANNFLVLIISLILPALF
jgi:hypothetical protein